MSHTREPAKSLDLDVLVIDDNRAEAEAAAEALERIGCRCTVADSGRDGLEIIREGNVDLILTDLVMRDVSGIQIVEETKRYWPDKEVIVFTGHASIPTAVEAMQKGAMTYLEKPLNIDVLRSYAEKAAEKVRLTLERAELRRQLDKRYGFEGIIGQSGPMLRIFDIMGQVAATDATVLIQGESGTGKELVARAIHNFSPRRARPFVALNCAALSESILESELFGHEKGAFTGADQQRRGRFEYAQRGTLFLDEVGDMPLSTQIKLLRVIEYREIVRVGSNVPIRVDVRLIAGTNQNLEQLVREKRFREDLYFRLNVVRIDLPPLRERLEDIPLLVEAFIKEFNQAHGKQVKGITPELRKALYRYPWPGNVRELRNCIEAMVVTSRSEVLDVADLPPYIVSGAAPVRSASALPTALPQGQPEGMPLEEVEKQAIRRTLEITGGNRKEAARILKIPERTLYRKLDRYGLK